MVKSISLFSSEDINSMPIVAIGSSAGGLKALECFFNHMPFDSGMAFVVICHLSPHYKSLLPELLQQHTKMKVMHIISGKPLLPNHVYIIPPNTNLNLKHGTLQLMQQGEPRHIELPIDNFFCSLAQQWNKQIIGIILSGTGADGTVGLRAIKEARGYIIVQSPSSAEYDGMPRSAINTGLVDAILPPEEMPRQLLKYSSQAIFKPVTVPEPLQYIYLLLKNHTKHDFSLYKQKTIHRRIQRRMAIHQIDTLENYACYLQHNPCELDALFKELLIGVTQFFRDPAAFEALKQQWLLKLNEDKLPDDGLRIWIPGCSHGEEVYSIAILLHECLQELNYFLPIKIFGTDIDEAAINIARAGLYPARIAADVSAERLQKFFTKAKDTYSVNKNIREMVVFACQNIIRDPPFTKLDMISCRNVLIYFDASLQKAVLPLFHYCLKPNGILFLSTSETVSGFVDLFNSIDKKWKIFEKRAILLSRQSFIHFPILAPKSKTEKITLKEKAMQNIAFDISQIANKFLLDNFAPPCVIVNESGDILYIHGKTGQYLELAPGKVRYNVLEMISEEIKTELISALHQAIVQHKEIIVSNQSIKTSGHVQMITLKVKPLLEQEAMAGLFIVIFEPTTVNLPLPQAESPLKPTAKWAKQIAELQQALKETKASLQIAIEEHKASNEELQSANEELQSNNEEIETSKEELQSLNEELVTVNSELQSRIDQLSSTNDDMKNFLDSTEIATLFLNNHLCIKRFTPKVTQIVNLISEDIGRPISHFIFNLEYKTLIEDAYEVLKTLNSKSQQVKSKEGHWYLMRIIPYRTAMNVVEGVVVTFTSIHSQKQIEERLRQLNNQLQDALDYSNNIIATLAEPFLVLDADLKIISANHAYYQLFHAEPAATQGQFIYEVSDTLWDIPPLKKLLEQIIPQNNVFNGFEVSHTFPQIGPKRLLLNARRIFQQGVGMSLIFLAIKDITDQSNTKELAQ